MSVAAYRSTIRESETPRQIERRLMSQVAGRLQEQAHDFDGAKTQSERQNILAQGLRENLIEAQTLWAAMRHDLAEPGNALPPALRGQLLSIALWIDREISNALGGRGTVGHIASVNRAISDGLAGRAPGPQA